MGSRRPASDEPVPELVLDPELEVALEPPVLLVLVVPSLPVLTVPFLPPAPEPEPEVPEGTTTRVEPGPVAGPVATAG